MDNWPFNFVESFSLLTVHLFKICIDVYFTKFQKKRLNFWGNCQICWRCQRVLSIKRVAMADLLFFSLIILESHLFDFLSDWWDDFFLISFVLLFQIDGTRFYYLKISLVLFFLDWWEEAVFIIFKILLVLPVLSF